MPGNESVYFLELFDQNGAGFWSENFNRAY